MHAQHDRGTGGRAALAAGLALILCGLSARDARAATWYTDQKATGNQDGKSWENATTTLDAGIKKLAPGDTLLVRGDAIYTNEGFSATKAGPSATQHTVVQGVPGEGAGELPMVWGGALIAGSGFTKDVPDYPNVWRSSYKSVTGYDILEVYPAGTYFSNIYSNHNEGIWYSKQSNVAAVNSSQKRWYADTTAKILYINPHSDTMADWDVVSGVSVFWQPAPGISNVTVSGFVMKQGNEFLIRLYYAGNKYITFSGNTFVKCYRSALYAESGGMPGIIVCSNTFIRNGTSFPNVNNSAIFDNTVMRANTGIFVSGSSNTVFNNVCYSNTTGITASKLGPDSAVYGNTCYGNTSYGMQVSTPKDCSVYNNTCYNNNYNLGVELSTNCAVFNNTLYNAGTYSLYLTKASQNLKVFNNLSWARGSGDYAVYVDAAASPAYSGDYNDFHATDGATFGYFGGANKTDLGEWRTATGQDANSLSADPGVTSTGTVSVLPDLRLTRRSPCRDAGTASFMSVSAPAFDGEGDARPFEGLHDIGSDEMTIPAPGTLILVN